MVNLVFLTILLLFIPVSLILDYGVHASPVWVFATAAVAIVSVADWMRKATDKLAHRTGPAIGGLVNVTFGSLAELILALFVLKGGEVAVVKAQITGSLIGTSLVGLGVAILLGGLKRGKQTFPREQAGSLASLMVLSVIALLLPALFDFTERHLIAPAEASTLDDKLSLSVSAVLILVYAANLVYTFVTHRDDVFESRKSEDPEIWPIWQSIAVLVGGTVIVAIEAEMVASSLRATADILSLSSLFLGVIVLALIGNAPDIIAAAYFARQDRMGLVMGICLGSTVQVALLLAPALVLISHFMGHPMNLIFSNPLELVAIVGMVWIVSTISADGETNWFEGLLLISVYYLFGFAFFFAKTAG